MANITITFNGNVLEHGNIAKEVIENLIPNSGYSKIEKSPTSAFLELNQKLDSVKRKLNVNSAIGVSVVNKTSDVIGIHSPLEGTCLLTGENVGILDVLSPDYKKLLKDPNNKEIIESIHRGLFITDNQRFSGQIRKKYVEYVEKIMADMDYTTFSENDIKKMMTLDFINIYKPSEGEICIVVTD